MRFWRFQRPLHQLVATLPPRDLVPLALAIAALFALMGPVSDVMNGAGTPASVVVRNALFSSLVAIGFAFGVMRRNAYLFFGTLVLHAGWIWYHARLGQPAPPVGDATRRHLSIDAIAIVVLMIASYSCFLWFINGAAARYLRIRAEMELAHQIHQVLVPAVATTLGGFDFAGFSQPSGEVGGDLVDVVPSASAEGPPGWFGYVADVSGHGVSSGVVMGMFKSALRMRLMQPGTLADLLQDLNTVLIPLKSGSMYVTAACVRATGAETLEYAVAGHLPILRVRGGAVEEITTAQIPVGLFEEHRFVAATMTCERGDLFAIITDGLTEVFDARDRELGIDGVKRILAANHDRPLREIGDAVVAAARSHGRQLDDQTLLLIRRT